MSSISAASSSSYQSPLQRLQDELQSEVNSGTIDASDQDALSSALTDIDSSMQADGAADQSGGARPSPDAMKSKLDDLINQEVSNGKLTSDQATELQGVFKTAFSQGAGHAHGHHGGGDGADAASSADPNASDASSTSTGSVSDVLQQFLQSLQDSQSSSLSSLYNATGGTSASSNPSFAALLIDYQS